MRKLHGAALVGPGLTNIDIVKFVENLNINPVYFQEDTAGRLAFKPCPTCKVERAFPPATSTFLAFGFEPVTATIQLTENGNLNIFGVGFGGTLTSNTVYSSLNLQISNVKVNGVPLSVGNSCHIVHPITAVLVGLASSKPPYSLQQGGPLTGTITVPKFKGCGVSENLDRDIRCLDFRSWKLRQANAGTGMFPAAVAASARRRCRRHCDKGKPRKRCGIVTAVTKTGR